MEEKGQRFDHSGRGHARFQAHANHALAEWEKKGKSPMVVEKMTEVIRRYTAEAGPKTTLHRLTGETRRQDGSRKGKEEPRETC